MEQNYRTLSQFCSVISLNVNIAGLMQNGGWMKSSFITVPKKFKCVLISYLYEVEECLSLSRHFNQFA